MTRSKKQTAEWFDGEIDKLHKMADEARMKHGQRALTPEEHKAEDEQIERDQEFGAALLGKILEWVEAGEHDPDTIAHTMWVDLTHYLVQRGWDVKHLVEDTEWHAKDELPWTRSTYTPRGGSA